MPVPTLLDIVKANGRDGLVELIDETIKAHPEMAQGAARTIKGINYKTLVRTGLGRTTGSFRIANRGSQPIVNTYENRLVETFVLEARTEVDIAVADSYEDGALAYIAMEAQGVLEGEMQGVCGQFYYGAANNPDGFPGLMQGHDAANMVVDAGGTTEDTCSSVWLARMGPQDVQWVWGNNGQLVPSAVRRETIIDSTAQKGKFEGYVQTLYGRPGLAVHNLQSVVRIKKLTADAGKGLTDSLIADALAKFPVGKSPTHIFASRRSLVQLQKSRQVVIGTGPSQRVTANVEAIGPVPASAFDIPIYVTDSIKNTEKLAA